VTNTFKRVISTTAPTSTGTVDYTVTGLGPSTDIKAVEVEVARATALDTNTDGRSGCKGFSDGTTEAVLSWSGEHNVGTTDTYTYSAQDKVVALMDPADGSLEAVATFDSFITDGVRLNWTTAPSSAYRVAVVITAGLDVECDVQIVDPADAASGTVTVTPGYTAETHLVLSLAGTISTAFDGTLESSSSVSWGACSNDGTTVTQNAEAWSFQDAVTTTLDSGIVHLGRIASHVSSTALGVAYAASGFNASTGAFTLTTAGASATSAERLAVMLFHFPSNVQAKAFNHATETSTGTAAGDLGFPPQYLWYGLSLINATNAVRTNAQAGSYGSGHADETGVEWCASYSDQDNQSTSNTQSLVTETLIRLPLHSGSGGYTANVDSWDAGGYTLNYTAVLGSGRYVIGYAIEQDDSLAETIVESAEASDDFTALYELAQVELGEAVDAIAIKHDDPSTESGDATDSIEWALLADQEFPEVSVADYGSVADQIIFSLLLEQAQRLWQPQASVGYGEVASNRHYMPKPQASTGSGATSANYHYMPEPQAIVGESP